MKAFLYSPSKRATQSGKSLKNWVLEVGFEDLYREPVMGWVGSSSVDNVLSLTFNSKEDALSYANKNNISCQVIEKKKSIITRKSYSDNFKYNKLS
jgi:hypothetical protein